MLLFSFSLSVSYTEVWNHVCIMSSIDWYLAFADYTYSNTIHFSFWSCYGSPVVRFIRSSVSLSVGLLVRVSQVKKLLKTFKIGFLNAFKTESWFCDSNTCYSCSWKTWKHVAAIFKFKPRLVIDSRFVPLNQDTNPYPGICILAAHAT